MGRIKHAVVFKLKAGTSAEQAREIMAALAGLKGKIPGLLDFSGGPYSSPEGLNQGFTHGFVMTFADAASRDGYLPHPEHEKVKQLIFPRLEGGLAGVIAFDWEEQGGP
ncbi:MAG: Dabb family protein [Phycisphaerae bacterium]